MADDFVRLSDIGKRLDAEIVPTAVGDVHRLRVSSVGGVGGGGTEYVEGDATNPATGTVVLARNNDGNLQIPRVYTHGDFAVTFSGFLSMWNDAGVIMRTGDTTPMPVTPTAFGGGALFPAPALPADNTANATNVSRMGTYPMWFDGTNWDMARGTSVDGLLVNLGGNNDVTVTGTVSVSGSVAVTGPLTDTQLRATPVPISGTVTIQDGGNVITVDGTVSISGSVAVTGPLTDAQLRATPVPVSGTVSTKTDLTPGAPAAATVGTSSAAAVAANANRKGLHARNTSTAGQRISLGLGQTAVLDSGITLYPGDVFDMDEYTFDLGAVNAIASAASARLSYQEQTT